MGYVNHLAAEDGRGTECGEPWQGWQAPAGTADLPPDNQPRPHIDPIRQCRACLLVGRLRAELDTMRQLVHRD